MKWRFKLRGIREHLNTNDREFSLEESKASCQAIADRLENVLLPWAKRQCEADDISFAETDILEEIIDYLRSAEGVEEADEVLLMMWDWCDVNRVWVDLKEKQTSKNGEG